jgi:glycosyltransferase involved in cell wall biosynthesis
MATQDVTGSVNYSTPMLSVVLSFYNEEDVLPELIRRLRKVLDAECAGQTIRDYELIFVNDASTDRSEEILKEAAQGRQDLKILTMSRNFGISPCVLAGMEYASGDLIVYMDADLQDPPEVIPTLIQTWKEQQVDVVHTVRLSRAGESRMKLWITQVGYFILQHVSTVHLPFEAGDFKLLSRRAVNHLIQFKEKKPFMRGLVCWIGFPQATVRYRREARFSGKTKFPVYSRKVIRNFLDSALISFSDVPLQFSLFAGFLISLGAFLYLLYMLIATLRGQPLPTWSPLMVVVLLLGGTQLLTIGVLGLYINSIFLETKGRPNYIIDRTFGFDDHHEIKE